MRKLLFAGLILILFPWRVFAGTPAWIKTDGPRGGVVYDIAVNPTNSSIVFAAADESGLHVSSNGGENWKPANFGVGKPIELVAISKVNPSVLHGASRFQFVCKSIDGGKTWTLINIGGVWIRDIVLDTVNINIGYLATDQGVYKTTDGGGLWNPYNSGLSNLEVRALTMDPANPNILYAATAGGVFLSSNAASSWAPRNTGLANLDVFSVIIDPLNPLALYAGTNSGISKTINAGGSWSNTAVTGGVSTLAIDPVNSNNVYAGTRQAGLLRSIDYGLTWNPANFGLVGKKVFAIAVDPLNPSVLYTGHWGTGVFKSTNSGSSWSLKSVGLNASTINSLSTAGDLLYASAESGVPHSWDGLNWGATASEAIPDLSVHAVAADPVNPLTAFAATNEGVYKTTGSAWSYSGLSSSTVYGLVMSPTSSTTLYAGTWGGGGVYKTTNSGSSWTAQSSGLLSTSVNSIAIDPTASNFLYVGTSAGVFSSTNSAGSWAYIGPVASPCRVFHDPVSHLTVYALAQDKLYRSVNGGGNWTLLKTFNTGISRVSVSKANTSVLYALADYSVYRSQDGGFNWTELINGKPSFSNLQAINAHPTIAERAFLGTSGQGIYQLIDMQLWDDFNDKNITGWTVSSGSWGALTGVVGGSTTKKMRILSPTFGPCSGCIVEADVQIVTAGGKASVYWYQNKTNYIQVEMNDAKNKLKVSQKVDGITIWKKSVSLNIDPMATYHLKLNLHNDEVALLVDGELLVLQNATIPAAGSIMLQVKASDGVNTSGRFDNIAVY